MDDLKKQAEELGIKIDGRWSDDRIREEIDKALAGAPASAPAEPASEPAEPVVPVLLKTDYWPFEGDRRKAGETLDVAHSKARELIRAGKAERADEMPGEA